MSDIRLTNRKAFQTERDIGQQVDKQFIELGLKHERKNHQDYIQIKKLLNHYLSYPSSEMAQLHRVSNKLGGTDHKNIQNLQENSRGLTQSKIRAQRKVCKCCGFMIQKSQLSPCSDSLSDLNNIGTYQVFFKTIIQIIFMLLMMVIVYSIFALVTDIIIFKQHGQLQNNSIALTLGAKYKNSLEDNKGPAFFLISSWLGLTMIAIWGVIFYIVKKKISRIQGSQKNAPSCADFSVVIQKMPTDLTKQNVQQQINKYFQEKLSENDLNITQLKIQKYNEAKPFYFNQEQFKDKQLEYIQKNTQFFKNEFIQWILDRQQYHSFLSTRHYREQFYKAHKQNQHYARKKYIQIYNKIKQKMKQNNLQTKTHVFISFETIDQRNFFLKMNPNHMLHKLKSFFCWPNQSRFSVQKDGETYTSIIVQPAPQPEDIRWGNIGMGKCESFWRRFMTAIVTVVLLAISFGIVYGLSALQRDKSSQRFLSILISLVISLFNLIFIKAIQFTTVIERHVSGNNYQTSLAVKSIIAQLLNSVATPMLVTYYIKKGDIYHQSGLIQDIFILSITSSFVPPFIRLIDPYYIFLRLKQFYYSFTANKLGLNQSQLNLIHQKPQFQLGLEYIYPISIFIFICFFVSLQPIISIFGVVGLIAMYWIQKSKFFNYSQRPVPGSDVMGSVMQQFIYFGGVAFALGSLTWSIFLPNSKFRSSVVANFVNLGISVILFLFPYSAFVKNDQKTFQQKPQTYQNRRIFFSTQYDRLNPVTKDAAIQDYKEYVKKKKQQFQQYSCQQQVALIHNLNLLTQPNLAKNGDNTLFGDSADKLINGIFLKQTKNFVNPRDFLPFFIGQEENNQDDSGDTTSVFARNQDCLHSHEMQQKPQLSKSHQVSIKVLNVDFKKDKQTKKLQKKSQHTSRVKLNAENEDSKNQNNQFQCQINLAEILGNIYRSNIKMDQIFNSDPKEQLDRKAQLQRSVINEKKMLKSNEKNTKESQFLQEQNEVM